MNDAQMLAEFYALRRRYGNGEMDWDDPNPPPDPPYECTGFGTRSIESAAGSGLRAVSVAFLRRSIFAIAVGFFWAGVGDIIDPHAKA